jgi:Secretion system C-terminal sorting domain/SprB repeat
MKIFYTTLGLCLAAFFGLHAQINDGGTLPLSWENPAFATTLQNVSLPALDMNEVEREDAASEARGEFYHTGRILPVQINPKTQGKWQTLPNGDRIWKIQITAQTAKAMNLYFSKFNLPKGARMHVYSPDYKQVIGGFGYHNNIASGEFATELLKTNSLIVEYYEPAHVAGQGRFIIEEVGHHYKDAADFGDSGSCNVNVNCSEGSGKTQQRDAVTRIMVRVGALQGWCTGTMINNTSQNCTPYLLTAMHCSLNGSNNASAADVNQWIFYFNFQSANCPNPSTSPTSNTTTGAVRKAYANDGGGTTGSDFYLLQLNSNPLAAWNVFYAGWDRNNTATTGGYGIHHPAGDIKKISIFTSTTPSTSWGGTVLNTHWGTTWVATANGNGITEGGSSGSALFNSAGRIIGSLTGGGSGCSSLASPDSYGKFSYHWSSNGANSTLRLSDWLDPTNTGALTLNGVYFPCSPALDAGISAISNPINGQLICANPFAPAVVIRNFGSSTLTSATINYRVDAGSISTTTWSGSLASNATATITLPNVLVSNNTNFIFRAWTSNPNGTADANIINDTSAATSRYNLSINTPYAEAFNVGTMPTNLTFSNPDLDTFVWEYISGISAFGTGTGSLMFDNFNGTGTSNPQNKLDWTFLPTFNFTGLSNPQIRFDLAYQFYNATFSDTLIVAVATNCGINYTSVFYQGGTQISTAGTGTTQFTPTAAQWATRTVDLSAYANQNNISIAIINYSGYGNRIFLDNINVGTSCSLTPTIASATNINCFGASTGAATASASGGVSPYTFSWSNGRNTAANTGLIAGVYTVTITDATGSCSGTSSVTITQPASALSLATTSNTAISCFGGNTGSFIITASGGTTPYLFNRGTGNQSTGTFSTLTAANYNVTVTDGNSCTATRTVSITQPAAALNSSIGSQTNLGCFGGNTGSFTINATGGTSPYVFNRGTGNQSTGTFSALTAGTYNVTITDANGCTTTRTVTLTQPASGIVPSVGSLINPTCNGSANGSFIISATGGTSPYVFNRGTGNQSTGTFSALTAGTYNVTITDASGCITVQTASLTQPAAANSSISSQSNVSCFGGNNGSLTVSASGASPFLFNIGSGNQSNGAFNNLTAGVYTITITDANGCTTTRIGTITQPAAGVSSSITTQTNVSCFGGNTGAFTIAVTGGVSPYLFNRGLGNQTNGNFTALAAGTYNVTIADANNCSTVQSVTLNQPTSAPTLSISNQNNVSCFGGTNGSITINANGGTAPYQYNRGTGSQFSNLFSNLNVGNYNFTVTDANGCATSINTTISQPNSALSLNTTTTAQTCAGADGTATATAIGGTVNYNYVWSNGMNGASLNSLNAGLLNVTVTDANGCTATNNAIVSNNCTPCSVTFSSTTNNATCAAACNGSATLTGANGATPYSFIWQDNSNATTRNGLCAGGYNVTVVDAQGCTATNNVSVNASAGITASTSSTGVNCFGQATGSAAVLQSNGATPLTYAWSNGINNSTINNAIAGNYSVTITDANGCTVSSTAQISQPTSALTATTNSVSPTNSQGNNGSITVTANGGTSPYSYNWAGIGTNLGDSQTGLSAGTYVVTVVDANGCQTTTIASLVFTGLENNRTFANSFLVMPNPSNGIFTIQIELNQAQETNLQITNVLGQVLRTYQFNTQNITLPVDISEQAAGVYFITLQNGSQIQTMKISSFQK